MSACRVMPRLPASWSRALIAQGGKSTPIRLFSTAKYVMR